MVLWQVRRIKTTQRRKGVVRGRVAAVWGATEQGTQAGRGHGAVLEEGSSRHQRREGHDLGDDGGLQDRGYMPTAPDKEGPCHYRPVTALLGWCSMHTRRSGRVGKVDAARLEFFVHVRTKTQWRGVLCSSACCAV